MVANITNSFGMGCGLRVLRLRDVSCGVLGLWILVGMFLDWFLASRTSHFVMFLYGIIRTIYGVCTGYLRSMCVGVAG